MRRTYALTLSVVAWCDLPLYEVLQVVGGQVPHELAVLFLQGAPR